MGAKVAERNEMRVSFNRVRNRMGAKREVTGYIEDIALN